MLLTEEVELTWGNNKKIYEPKGYIFTNRGDKFKVKINDLALGSNTKVDVLCDYCFEEGIKTVKHISYCGYISSLKNSDILNKDACNKCKNKKQMEINLIKHGVKSNFSLKSAQEKFKKTMLERYGVEYTAESPDLFNKMKKTNLERLGCEFTFQSPEVREKSKNTMIERHGAYAYVLTKDFIENNSLENHWNWQGGITSQNELVRQSLEYKQWRLLVFEKDNYTCQGCGDNKGHNLNAHHKYNFSKYLDMRLDVNNGITLCDNCHDFRIIGSFHYIYGTKNNTPEQLEEYIKAKQQLQKEAI